MPGDPGPGRAGRLAPWCLALAAFGLYVATLAPGLLWGDSAKFQRMAWEGELRFDEMGHPLWVLLVRPLTRVPGLDPALGCNLSSALLSSLALVPAWRIMRRAGAGPAAAGLACVGLALSHTYWFHAVITEVYALNSLLSLAILDLAISAADRKSGGAPSDLALFAAGLAYGLGAGNHNLLLLWLPGLAWFAYVSWRTERIRRAGILAALCGFAAGIAPFAALRPAAARLETQGELVERLARHFFSQPEPLRDAILFAGCLLYQFPVPVMLAAAASGVRRVRRDLRIGLLLLYAGSAVFAFSFPVKDRFAFYLPSYLVVALLAGPGMDVLVERLRSRGLDARAASVVLLAGCAAAPLLYAAAPAAAGPFDLQRRLGVRDLPGRDPLRYHLLPWKRGEAGARRFAEEALAAAPPRSLILADHTLAEPLNYLQLAEGRRPDVVVTYATPPRQLQAAVAAQREGRAVLIAARDAYYGVESLERVFELRPAGPIWRLEPRGAATSEGR